LPKIDKTLDDLLIQATLIYQHCEFILARYENTSSEEIEERDTLKKELLKQSRAHERLTKKIKSMREQEFLASPYYNEEDNNIPMRWLLRAHGLEPDSLDAD
jgi:hypothetical protein